MTKKSRQIEVTEGNMPATKSNKAKSKTPHTPDWDRKYDPLFSARTANMNAAAVARVLIDLANENSYSGTEWAGYKKPRWVKGAKNTSNKFGSKENSLFKPQGKFDTEASGYKEICDALRKAKSKINSRTWDKDTQHALFILFSWTGSRGGGGRHRNIDLTQMEF